MKTSLFLLWPSMSPAVLGVGVSFYVQILAVTQENPLEEHRNSLDNEAAEETK